MVSIVPSRFAGLKIEDDDDDETPMPKKTNKNQNKSKAGQSQTAPANGKQGNKVCKIKLRNFHIKLHINKKIFRTRNQINQERKREME